VAWVSYQPLIMTHNRFCREDLRLTEELQKEKAKQARLLEAIEAVKKDPKVVERLAREKLGLAKPGETVVHFD
jgi:cell division protein FtsB